MKPEAGIVIGIDSCYYGMHPHFARSVDQWLHQSFAYAFAPMINMNVNGILDRIPITGPYSEMPEAGKANHLPFLLCNENRKTIIGSFIVPV